MSYVETPAQTLVKFDQNLKWRGESIKTLTHDFFSIGNETNLLWNPFYYEERDGKLFDPVREKNIEGTANGDIVEEGINKQLENWFLTHESGIGVWISPRGGQLRPYPEEQITIYRIAYKWSGRKILLLSSCNFKSEFKNPEELRRFIFTEDDKEESVLEIIGWLKQISKKEIKENLNPRDVEIRMSFAEHYAYQYKNGTPMYELVEQMKNDRFLGENPIGCGSLSATNSSGLTVMDHSLAVSKESYWHLGTCRVCKRYTMVGPCGICASCARKF